MWTPGRLARRRTDVYYRLVAELKNKDLDTTRQWIYLDRHNSRTCWTLLHHLYRNKTRICGCLWLLQSVLSRGHISTFLVSFFVAVYWHQFIYSKILTSVVSQADQDVGESDSPKGRSDGFSTCQTWRKRKHRYNGETIPSVHRWWLINAKFCCCCNMVINHTSRANKRPI